MLCPFLHCSHSWIYVFWMSFFFFFFFFFIFFFFCVLPPLPSWLRRPGRSPRWRRRSERDRPWSPTVAGRGRPRHASVLSWPLCGEDRIGGCVPVCVDLSHKDSLGCPNLLADFSCLRMHSLVPHMPTMSSDVLLCLRKRNCSFIWFHRLEHGQDGLICSFNPYTHTHTYTQTYTLIHTLKQLINNVIQ